MDDIQTLDTDPDELSVDSAEGEENDAPDSEDTSENGTTPSPDDALLARLNEAAGKKGQNAYKTLDEALKGVENLKRKVGEKQQPALTADEKYGFMAQKLFGFEHPEAKNHLDVITPYAKDNKLSLDEAWETKFADVFTKEVPPQNPEVIKPSTKVRPAINPTTLEKLDKMSYTEMKDNWEKIVKGEN